ncbi:MAG: transposase [Lachnospiraceae bacterium]|nr:transposase [Lachnospiraceae bacterium]
MYTTNAIEAINSSFRKVTKKGAFPNEDAVMKLLYLRTEELYKKWNDRPIANWAMVKNQLIMDDKIQARIIRKILLIIICFFSHFSLIIFLPLSSTTTLC